MKLRSAMLTGTLGALLVAPLCAMAAESAEIRTVEFSAEASRAAPNDLVVATLYSERSGTDAAALAREVNRTIASALDTARPYSSVKTQTAGTSTWPVYGKDGRGRVESWRMRAEIRLEGRDVGAISELIGKLQATLALAQVVMQPAPETRRKVADDTTVDALRAFEKRAELIAGTLGRRYRLHQLSIAESGSHPPFLARMRAAPAMAAEAASAPLEGGESQVGVSVTGRIELLD